jgi:rhomboid protease GluP
MNASTLLIPPPALTDLMRSKPREVPVTTSLLAINVSVFLVMLAFGAGLWHSANGVQLAWGANFGPATQDGQWWRLFTALFIHFGVVHLAFNMFALWDIGRLVERLFGRTRFLLLYLGSGVIGNVLSLVVQGNQAVSGGASGSIFSLYGALLVFLWRERKQVDASEFRWLFGGSLLFTAVMLGMGFVVTGIDNSAHCGGLVAGMLLGHVMLQPWTADSAPLPVSRALTGVLTVVVVAVLATHIPQPKYLFGDELRARAAIEQFMNTDHAIRQRYAALLGTGMRGGASFDEVAGGIDTNVAAVYERSFEQLMAAGATSNVPSAQTLQHMQAYATEQAHAARDVAQGFRSNDPAKIRNALNKHAKNGDKKP